MHPQRVAEQRPGTPGEDWHPSRCHGALEQHSKGPKRDGVNAVCPRIDAIGPTVHLIDAQASKFRDAIERLDDNAAWFQSVALSGDTESPLGPSAYMVRRHVPEVNRPLLLIHGRPVRD